MKSAAEVAELFRDGFANLKHLDPEDVDLIVLGITGSLRQLRPEQFGCMSKLPPPGPIFDPRKAE